MGIDAEILIRGVPRTRVNKEWLKKKSWLLAEAIGAEHFFTSDGLYRDEYQAAIADWHKRFNEHPLYPEYRLEGHGGTAHTQILKDIGPAPEELRLAIDVTRDWREGDELEDGEKPFKPGTVYQQDGDDIIAEAGECLLTLSLWGRYYGPGYERGDILTYCAIAEWLEANIAGCTVWYGGDSSGVEAELFDAEKRAELRRHLYSKHGRDYVKQRWNPPEPGAKVPPACGLCPGAVYCGSQYGFGPNYAAWSCPGCGKSVESRDHGETWTEAKRD